MKKTIAMGCLALLACGATSTRVNGPDGEGAWYSITCKRSRANCVEEAGEVCPHGYDVADGSEHKGVRVNVNQFGGYGHTTYDGQMLIKCRNRQRRPPPQPVPTETASPDSSTSTDQ